MRQKSDIEMERQKTVKILRTWVRLKHSLAADEELNKVLPATVAEFDKALQNGEVKRLSPKFDELLGE